VPSCCVVQNAHENKINHGVNLHLLDGLVAAHHLSAPDLFARETHTPNAVLIAIYFIAMVTN
jgi:hypothetical protein